MPALVKSSFTEAFLAVLTDAVHFFTIETVPHSRAAPPSQITYQTTQRNTYKPSQHWIFHSASRGKGFSRCPAVMWQLPVLSVSLVGGQICRPSDFGPQSQDFVNVEAYLVDEMDVEGRPAGLAKGRNLMTLVRKPSHECLILSAYLKKRARLTSRCGDLRGLEQHIFPHGPQEMWGGICETLSVGCVRYLADKFADAGEQDGLPKGRQLRYRQEAFFLTSEICFDDADEAIVDSRLLTVMLADHVPAFSSHFVGQFSYLHMQHLSRSTVAVSPQQLVRVTTLGAHAALMLEVRKMWEQYVSAPLIFEFNEISLDTKRCQAASCPLKPTMHASFRQLAENMLHLGQLGEPVMLEMDRLLPDLVAAVLSKRPDIAVCTHPPFICRILHVLARINKIGVVGFFGGNIEAMVHVDELLDWVQELYDMARLPNVKLFTNSAFISIKTFAMTGVVTSNLPVFGLGTDMVWNPQRQEVLVWKSSHHCCDNIERFWGRVASAAESAQLQYDIQHLRLLREKGEAGYDQLSTYQAVVMFQYDVVLFSFFELYHAAMPIFAPDIYSSSHYVWRGAINAPRYGDDQPDRLTVRPGWPTDWVGLKRELRLDFDDRGIDLHPRRIATDVRARFFWAHALELYSCMAVSAIFLCSHCRLS